MALGKPGGDLGVDRLHPGDPLLLGQATPEPLGALLGGEHRHKAGGQHQGGSGGEAETGSPRGC